MTTVEQTVRETLARITKTSLLFMPAPTEELDPLGNGRLWATESLRRMTGRYGSEAFAMIELAMDFLARDSATHFALEISALGWQPDLVLALAEAAIEEQARTIPLGS